MTGVCGVSVEGFEGGCGAGQEMSLPLEDRESALSAMYQKNVILAVCYCVIQYCLSPWLRPSRGWKYDSLHLLV